MHSNKASHDRPYLNTRQAAELTGLAKNTLELWRRQGVGPPWIKVGAKRVIYRRADVESWLDANRRGA